MLRSLACVLIAAAPVAAQEYVPGRVLVHDRGAAGASSHVRVLHVRDTDAALAELRDDPSIEWVERDYIRHRTAVVTPNDEMYGLQWALPAIHAPAAWARATGSAGIVVAVIDTGVLPHPDLKDRLVAGWDFVSDPANAGDGDGRDADASDPGTLDASSSMLHGTHVSGIIGAVANNGVGVAGLDWGCRIQPVRVLGVRGGTGADSDIVDAIRWAAGLHVDNVPDNATPADVINLSFDGRGRSLAMQEAVDEALARGVAVVAAAGNDAADSGDDVPAGLAGVITVGAVDSSRRRAAYSNFGPTVTLLAPGGSYDSDGAGRSEGILSTLFAAPMGWTYVDYAGTSQAAPYVAGTISLMKSVYAPLTPRRARSLLAATADAGSRCASPANAVEPGCGAGLLDVDGAVAAAAAQWQCGERCRDDQMCSAGQCVAGASALIDGGRAASGCQLAGASGRASSLVILCFAIVVAAARRCRRLLLPVEVEDERGDGIR